jgi:hypothetical protein
MRVIHWVPDKFTTRSRQAHDTFTTKNRSRWISFNFVRYTFMTDFYSRLVRELVANESWSRLCCRRFGQSMSRMLSCDFYAVRRHHVILQAKTFSWCRHKADSVGDIFFRWIIFNITSLHHDSFTTAVVNESQTGRKLVGNPVDHPHYLAAYSIHGWNSVGNKVIFKGSPRSIKPMT